MKLVHCLAFAIAITAGPALSQQAAGPVEASLTASKIVIIDGKEAMRGADTAKPGDIIEYSATYLNKSDKPATQLVATLPIPQGTELLAKTARPDGAKASVDGIHFAPMPLKRMVRKPDRSEVEELVPLAEYRALRWQVDRLEGGRSLVYTARVKLIELPDNKQKEDTSGSRPR